MKYFLFLLCLWAYSAEAQKTTAPPPKIQFSAAYYHNGTINPGLQLGADWVLKNNVKTKLKEKRRLGTVLITRRRQLALEGRLGFFWDPLTQVAVFNQYLLSGRLVYQKPEKDHPQWMMALGLGVGYLRSFLPETYTVNTVTGEVSDPRLASRGYLGPIVAFKFIRERPEKKLNAWFLEFNTQWLFNYNSTAVPLNNLVFGFRFNLQKTSS